MPRVTEAREAQPTYRRPIEIGREGGKEWKKRAERIDQGIVSAELELKSSLGVASAQLDRLLKTSNIVLGASFAVDAVCGGLEVAGLMTGGTASAAIEFVKETVQTGAEIFRSIQFEFAAGKVRDELWHAYAAAGQLGLYSEKQLKDIRRQLNPSFFQRVGGFLVREGPALLAAVMPSIGSLTVGEGLRNLEMRQLDGLRQEVQMRVEAYQQHDQQISAMVERTRPVAVPKAAPGYKFAAN